MNINGLGKVQPVTQRAAEEFARTFNVFNIGGYRAVGSVPGSDHPKGLAIDIMTNVQKTGDRYANWFLANGGRLGVTYVIWNRRIYDLRNGKGWQPYSGPSPHTDHVHVSFSENGGDPNAAVSNLGTAGSAMDNAGCLSWLFSNSAKESSNDSIPA